MWKKRMHTAHSIHHLRYSQMDDETRQRKRLFRRQFVLFSHEFHHFHGCDRCRFVQVWVEAEREPAFHGTSPRQCQCQLTGILRNGFWVKFRGCLAITNSRESCSGPATACTGTKLTRRTKFWSYGCGVSAGTANWSVPAAGGSSARSTTVENGRCVICRGASSRPPYTLRCIG